jgi:hypothetical protein
MRIDDVTAGAPLTAEEEAAGDALGTIILGYMTTLDGENEPVADILAKLPPEVLLIESVPTLPEKDIERLIAHFGPHVAALREAKN